MRYGISAGAIILQENKILLANHRFSPEDDFWVPPGGKLEGDESIFDCARREAKEETGLDVLLDRIVYIQEFAEPDYHFCKFFILCNGFSGSLTLANKERQEDFLVGMRFFSQDDIHQVVAYPEVLRGEFWDDLAAGFPQTKYLGIQRFQ